MSARNQHELMQEASESGRLTVVHSAVAFSALLLAIAQHQHPPVVPDASLAHRIERRESPGTLSKIALEVDVSTLAVFHQLNRVYDSLLANQIDLDTETRSLIYQRLWDLYE